MPAAETNAISKAHQLTTPSRAETERDNDSFVSSIASPPTESLHLSGAELQDDRARDEGGNEKKEDTTQLPPPSLESTHVHEERQGLPGPTRIPDSPESEQQTLPPRQPLSSQPGAYAAYQEDPGGGLLRRFRALLSHAGTHPDEHSHRDATRRQDLERQATDAGLVSAIPVLDDSSTEQNITHAQQVDDAQLHEQARKEQKKRKWQRLCYCLLATSLVFMVVGLGVGLGLSNNEKDTEIVPTLSPSTMPSLPPTTSLGLLLQGLDFLLQGLPESTLKNIYTTGTPQQQAYNWLVNHPNIANLPEWKMRQLLALVSFYFSFEGPSWPEAIQGSWLSYTQDECSWINTPLDLMYALSAEYIGTTDFDFRQCNEAGEVQTIWLLHLQLSNTKTFLPPEMAFLSSLTVFALLSSVFSASLSEDMIPALAPLANLEVLVIFDNALSGTVPADIALLSNLRYLLLPHNQLTGPIPSEAGKMSLLEQLWIPVNSLSGPIPSQLGSLTHITEIDLDMNSLSGTIPKELGGLSLMDVLRLGRNSLSGPIPTELGRMTELQHFSLHSNSLSGTIPSELGMASNMVDFGLAKNRFAGSIPTQIQTMSSLSVLFVYSNSFSGQIPTEVGLLTQLSYLNMRQNNLQGPLPSELGTLNSLHHLHLHGNALTGFIPQELAFLITNNASLESMTLQGNDLAGTVPDELCLLQKFKHVPGSPGLGLRFDCNEKLCGCHWCGCSGTGNVTSNKTETQF